MSTRSVGAAQAQATQLLDHSDGLLACSRKSSLAWIALSMAAISRTLVEGTWLKMLRYQCTTTHLCQAASRKNSAALSASPLQASEVISRTPFNPSLRPVHTHRHRRRG